MPGYTGVAPNSFNNSIPGPAAGSPVTAASIGLVAQGAADQDKFLHDLMQLFAFERKTVTDASQTLSTTSGCRFILPSAPAAPRTIKLPNSTASRFAELIAVSLATGQQYEIRREDNTVICNYYGIAADNSTVAAQFEYVGGSLSAGAYTGGVWKLGLSPGFNFADTAGVLSGPGA